MPNRVHVELNAVPTNHRWRCVHQFTIPNTPLVYERRFENKNKVLLGYEYPSSGFEFGFLTAQNQSVDAGQVKHWFFFNWPTRRISYLILLNATPTEAIVEGDSCEMAGTQCLGWTFNCGDFRAYVDGVLQFTIAGPFSRSGDVYDQIFNQSTVYSVTGGDETFRGYRFEDCSPVQGWTPLEVTESTSASVTGGWQWWNGVAWQSETTQADTAMVPLVAPVPTGCNVALACSTGAPVIGGVTTWTMTAASEFYVYSHYYIVFVGECLCTLPGGGSVPVELIRWRHVGETRKKSSYVSCTPVFEANLRVTRRSRQSCQGCYADIAECNSADSIVVEVSTYCQSRQEFVKGTIDDFCSYYPGGTCPDGTIPCQNDLSQICYYRAFMALLWDSPCNGSSGAGTPADIDWDVHGTRSLAYVINNELVLAKGSEIWPRNYIPVYTKYAASKVRTKFNRFHSQSQQFVLLKSPTTNKIRGYRVSDSVPDPATEFKPCAEDTPTMYDFEILNDNTLCTYWIDGTTIYFTIFSTNGNSIVTKTSTGITNVNPLVNLCVREQASTGGKPLLVLSYADQTIASGGTGRLRYRTSSNYVTFDVGTQIDVSTVEASYGVHECFMHGASRTFLYHTGGTSIYRRRFNVLGTALESATAISPAIDTGTDFHVCEGFYPTGLNSLELIYLYLGQRRIALSLNEGIDWLTP